MKKHITAFYLETLMLVAVFVGIILVLTGIFGRARAQSAAARQLTQVVAMAENAAEAVSAAGTAQELEALLAAQGEVTPTADGFAVAEGDYTANVTLAPQGNITAGHIAVFCRGQELYALDTAVCTGGAG